MKIVIVFMLMGFFILGVFTGLQLYQKQSEIQPMENYPCPSPKKNGNTDSPIGKSNIKRDLLVMPNNNCERLQGVILDNHNNTKLKENVAIFYASPSIPTNEPTNYNYCELAQWIWNGQTESDRQRLKGLEKYYFPDYCYKELPNAVIPEFGIIAVMILCISISIILLKSKLYK